MTPSDHRLIDLLIVGLILGVLAIFALTGTAEGL